MRIAIVGNCHAGVVAQAVRVALANDPALDCRHLVSDQQWSDDEKAFVSTADRLLVQIADFKRSHDCLDTPARRDTPPGKFPLIAGNFLYPFAGKSHPLAATTRSSHCPSGYYEGQVSDTALLEIMQRFPHEAQDANVQRWLALDYAALIDLDRVFEFNRVKMQRIGELAGLDLWPKIERSFRDRPVFWTYLHPTSDLMRDICRYALQQLALGLTDEEITVAIDSIHEPFGFAHMPIHPSVVRHFAIEWARPSYRYRFTPEGSFKVDEFAHRFLGFQHDDDLSEAIFKLHRDIDLDTVIRVLEQSRRRYAGNGDVLLSLSIAYWKRGRPAEAMEAAVSAVEIEPTNSDWARFLCIVARHSGLTQPAGEMSP